MPKRTLSLAGIISFTLILLFFAITPVSATIFLQNGTEISADQIHAGAVSFTNTSMHPLPMQFYYNTHCGSCQEALEYLNNFTAQNPDIKITYYDLYNSSANMSQYEVEKGNFKRNDIHYPVLFIGEVGLMGSSDIATSTEPILHLYQKEQKSSPVASLIAQISSIFGKI